MEFTDKYIHLRGVTKMRVAKINMAFNSEGEYISIKEARRGEIYFCLYCKDRLIANLGSKQIHILDT